MTSLAELGEISKAAIKAAPGMQAYKDIQAASHFKVKTAAAQKARQAEKVRGIKQSEGAVRRENAAKAKSEAEASNKRFWERESQSRNFGGGAPTGFSGQGSSPGRRVALPHNYRGV